MTHEFPNLPDRDLCKEMSGLLRDNKAGRIVTLNEGYLFFKDHFGKYITDTEDTREYYVRSWMHNAGIEIRPDTFVILSTEEPRKPHIFKSQKAK